MAARYWVGGSGTWDTTNTANWSATSGGAGGASVPTSADNAIINSASGGGTITIGENVPCIQLDIRTFTGTLDFNNKVVDIAGNNLVILRTDTGSTVTGNPIVNLTYSGSTGTRTIGTGATTETNSITVNVTAGSDTVTTLSASAFKTLNFTGFSGTLSNTAKTIYGNLIISSGMTVTSGANATTFAATSGTQQITTNGITIDHPITQNSPSATLQLQDNLTMGSTRAFTLTAGTLDLSSGNRTLSTGLFSSNNSNTRSIAFGTGNITLTGSAATIWAGNTAAATVGLTVTGTPVVNCTYSGSTGTRTISGGHLNSTSEANTISFNISAGSDTVTLNGSHAFRNVNFTGFSGALSNSGKYIFGDLTLSSTMTVADGTGITYFSSTSGTKTITNNGTTFGGPVTFNGVGGTWSFADAFTQSATRAFTIAEGTVKLKAGATSTVGAFATSGSNQKYLQSTTAGSQATLSQASGTVTVSYLSIKDIAATGGATWNAYVDYNNVDQGDNTGWDFSNSPAIDNEFPIALRSFTQPKRF